MSSSDIDSKLIDLATPVLKRSMGKDEFFKLLHRVAEDKYPHEPDRPTRGTSVQAQYRHYIRSIELFGIYLSTNNTTTINLDENLIDEFSTYLRTHNENGNDSYWSGLAGNIRTLINEMPATYLNRPLLPPSRIKTTKRLHHLTPQSQEFIKDFLLHGKKVSINRKSRFILKKDDLKKTTKNTAVQSLLTAFREIGINDITQLTAEKAERYNDTSTTATHHMNDIKCLYKYLYAQDCIDHYPLEDIPLKEIKSRDDFASVSSINRLLDLSDMFDKWTDFILVRNTAISIFLYDFASRINACTLLTIDDVAFVDDFLEVRFRPDTLKGNKETMYQYSFFPQTPQVMRMYIKLREKYYSKTDALFVSMTTKKRLTVGGARNAVKTYFKFFL